MHGGGTPVRTAGQKGGDGAVKSSSLLQKWLLKHTFVRWGALSEFWQLLLVFLGASFASVPLLTWVSLPNVAEVRHNSVYRARIRGEINHRINIACVRFFACLFLLAAVLQFVDLQHVAGSLHAPEPLDKIILLIRQLWRPVYGLGDAKQHNHGIIDKGQTHKQSIDMILSFNFRCRERTSVLCFWSTRASIPSIHTRSC